MIRKLNNLFILDTNETTYAFYLLPTGHLEHLYYGSSIRLDTEEDAFSLMEKRAFAPGNTNCYNEETQNFTLEDIRLEMSSYGKGDIREPFIELVHSDGGRTSDFLYCDYEIFEQKIALEGLPSSYDPENKAQTLAVKLTDKEYNQELILFYSVFEEQNVITRSAKLFNHSDETVKVNRLLSNQIDFETNDYLLTSFHGNWANEMHRQDAKGLGTTIVNSSFTGTSSSRSNPFVMLSKEITSEDFGPCYGFNLIYSGNHYEAVETNMYGKLRFVAGINPRSFEWTLNKEESFETPEAVMTFSENGFNGMSQNMHRFVRECIVRGEWAHKARPVLLNSWEAAYFNFDEAKLLRMAGKAKDVGVELFVMDDGWFAKRDNDTCSLGDWYVNKNKLKDGIEGLAKKVNKLGLDFGLWVEPEMINQDSDLFRAHPDWTLSIPGKPHTEGRHERFLDLCNPEVVDYMIDTMRGVFKSGNISYVKWDMNRIVSDYYSPYLPAEEQGQVAHRYVLGLYRMMDTLTKEFPHILFEGCSAGGNRFDLGILSYFPQIWASDDTDAVFRVNCQTSYSYGYPMNTVTAHVSACPNHQTLRVTPLITRFNVAAFGVLGYECNLADASKEDLKEITEQIGIYKEWRDVLQTGDFYRGRNGNVHEWTCVSKDKKKAVGMLMKELVEPNTQFEQYSPKGLDENIKYSFKNRSVRYNIKNFGDLVNTASPIHIKPDSLIHNIVAKFVTMPGETEDYRSYGSTLMKGVKLKQAFSATGYDENTRYFSDFASRMFFMEEVSTAEQTENQSADNTEKTNEEEI